jgi:hypothetical protein
MQNLLVKSSVFGLSRSDVEVRDDISVNSHVLADLESFRVCDFLSVKFPADFGRWISSCNTLDEDWIVGMENFL